MKKLLSESPRWQSSIWHNFPDDLENLHDLIYLIEQYRRKGYEKLKKILTDDLS